LIGLRAGANIADNTRERLFFSCSYFCSIYLFFFFVSNRSISASCFFSVHFFFFILSLRRFFIFMLFRFLIFSRFEAGSFSGGFDALVLWTRYLPVHGGLNIRGEYCKTTQRRPWNEIGAHMLRESSALH